MISCSGLNTYTKCNNTAQPVETVVLRKHNNKALDKKGYIRITQIDQDGVLIFATSVVADISSAQLSPIVIRVRTDFPSWMTTSRRMDLLVSSKPIDRSSK